LYSNRELEKWGIMHRKGFPESYDKRRLIRFLYALKSSRRNIKVPVYSHFAYDVMDETRIIDNPDVLIIEGLNVLQPAELAKDGKATPYVSDFLDFSIYLDAEEDVIRNWYVKRFLRLRQTAFRDPASYFHRYASMNDRKAEQTALDIWERINLPNLQQNISRTRQRADLILHKDPTHNVRSVLLRQV
jgi:type I pantothenate kinase